MLLGLAYIDEMGILRLGTGTGSEGENGVRESMAMRTQCFHFARYFPAPSTNVRKLTYTQGKFVAVWYRDSPLRSPALVGDYDGSWGIR